MCTVHSKWYQNHGPNEGNLVEHMNVSVTVPLRVSIVCCWTVHDTRKCGLSTFRSFINWNSAKFRISVCRGAFALYFHAWIEIWWKKKMKIQIIKITKFENDLYISRGKEPAVDMCRAAIMSKDIKLHLMAENYFGGVDKSDKIGDQTQILLKRKMGIERQNAQARTLKLLQICTDESTQNKIHSPKRILSNSEWAIIYPNYQWRVTVKKFTMNILFISVGSLLSCTYTLYKHHLMQRQRIWTVAAAAPDDDICHLCIHYSVIYQCYRHCVKSFTLFVSDRCTVVCFEFRHIEWYSFRVMHTINWYTACVLNVYVLTMRIKRICTVIM